MIAKTFEIRDRATFIPVLAVKLVPGCEADRYLFGRAGFGVMPEVQKAFVMVCRLDGGEGFATTDQHGWPGGTRTMKYAHHYIREAFDKLESGAVVDVEFIVCETDSPKRSERETAFL
jgi:hypothetical protein